MVINRRDISRLLFATAATLPFATLARAAPPTDDDDTGLPNTFISPCGKPFRAPLSAPYPVVDWFKQADTDGDGKLDHAEFMADTEAFFKVLDLNGDGVLDGYEVAIYEHQVAPEILGYRVVVGALQPPWSVPGRARLWLAQGAPSGDHEPVEHPQKQDVDESGQGASPFGFFQAPEPVTAADIDFRGLVAKANFLSLGERHFKALDHDGVGYLILAKLPKTLIQQELEKVRRRRS